MFKAMILLTRRSDMSSEDFANWWLNEHAPRARELPGVSEIRFNRVVDAEGIDGVAELWFDTREDFEAAYATDIGKAVAQDSMDHVEARVRLLVEENQILES